MKSNKFSICSKCKINYFKGSTILAHYSLIIMCSNIETPKIINFPFGTNGKLMVIGVPIFKHSRVDSDEIAHGTLCKHNTVFTQL